MKLKFKRFSNSRPSCKIRRPNVNVGSKTGTEAHNAVKWLEEYGLPLGCARHQLDCIIAVQVIITNIFYESHSISCFHIFRI